MKGCFLRYARGSGIFINVGQSRVHPFLYCPNCSLGSLRTGDKIIDEAIAMGLDTVQFEQEKFARHGNPPVIVITSPPCVSDNGDHEGIQTCLPTSTYVGWKERRLCRCSESLPMLNCLQS